MNDFLSLHIISHIYVPVCFDSQISQQKCSYFVNLQLNGITFGNQRNVNSEFRRVQRYLKIVLCSCETHQLQFVLFTELESVTVV